MNGDVERAYAIRAPQLVGVPHLPFHVCRFPPQLNQKKTAPMAVGAVIVGLSQQSMELSLIV
jgi:hypothetical protein